MVQQNFVVVAIVDQIEILDQSGFRMSFQLLDLVTLQFQAVRKGARMHQPNLVLRSPDEETESSVSTLVIEKESFVR